MLEISDTYFFFQNPSFVLPKGRLKSLGVPAANHQKHDREKSVDGDGQNSTTTTTTTTNTQPSWRFPSPLVYGEPTKIWSSHVGPEIHMDPTRQDPISFAMTVVHRLLERMEAKGGHEGFHGLHGIFEGRIPAFVVGIMEGLWNELT